MLTIYWKKLFVILFTSKLSFCLNDTTEEVTTTPIPRDIKKEYIYPASWGFPYKLHAKGGNSFAGLIKIPNRNNQVAIKYGGARIVQSSRYELEYVLGRKIIFICVAVGYPRPAITWYKDGVELYAHNYFQVHEWEIREDKLKSKMEIDPATPMDVGYYECQANNEWDFDYRGFRTYYL